MTVKRGYTADVTDHNGRNRRLVSGQAEVLDNAPDRAVKNVARYDLKVAGMEPIEITVDPRG